MGRLVFVIIMLVVSGIIYLVKAGAGKITGNEVNFQDESKKVMQKTAKGLNWMNEQWENAKSGNQSMLLNSNQSNKSAIEIIAYVKANPITYDKSAAEALYIENAVSKMNNKEFDDALKLIMQLDDGEGRRFMLGEIESQRNA